MHQCVLYMGIFIFVYIERLIRYLISDRSSRYLLLSIPIYPRSRCQIFVSLCPGQVSPGSCDQLRVSWSLATFQTEAAPGVVHCPDIRDSGVGSYTVTQDQLEECGECSGQLITLQSQLAMRRAAAAMCRYQSCKRSIAKIT